MVRTLHSTEGTTKAHALALSLMPVLSPDLGESGDDECAVQRGERRGCHTPAQLETEVKRVRTL